MDEENFMRRAIALAEKARGDTHPNPLVGAVLVEDGAVVAEGFHARAGTPHAERVALNALGRAPKRGATLFVTLEPCSTHGRTGACTDAILAAGVSRVVVGATDPNPAHAGRGLEILRARGVEVASGVLARECENLNPIFNYNIVTGEPLIAAKCALAPDGKMFFEPGKRAAITDAAARENVMRERRYFPAVATSSGTVLCDDPALTARVPGESVFCPTRFVFDRRGRTLARADVLAVFSDAFRGRTIFVTVPETEAAARAKLAPRGVGVWALPAETAAFWRAFRGRCAAAGITGVYCECGPTFLRTLFEARQADRLYAYVAGTPEKSPEKFFSAAARLLPEGERAFPRADGGRDVEIFGAVRYDS
ncbi:MAG: bifunctional diaminohydroxyphosphoribosylaminopyrimidine deaminase/5-amino-6-(5-phosphoribosylamino)uracil reductase RibD [Candidatus Spyradosoma sp.]